MAAPAAAGPGRHIRYAESGSRLVYAFVFGHKDSCRVIRRKFPPRFRLEEMLRRGFGASHKGVLGDRILAEFDFRGGRPVHIVPTNDGKYLLAFANRAADGSPPRQDRIFYLDGTGYRENIEYGALPRDSVPAWPVLGRALAEPKEVKHEPESLSYAFLTVESAPDRMLVARQSEDATHATEMICFVMTLPDGKAALPPEAELAKLLDQAEPLLRAGAAWALGKRGKAKHRGPIKAALARTHDEGARVVMARAIVECGEAAGRKTLRALLTQAGTPGVRRAAAHALALLPADRGDADALAAGIADSDARTAELAGMALARLGKPALFALGRAARSSKAASRAAVARTLGRIDGKQAESRLLALARDGDALVQTAAAVALTNPPRAILPQNHADFARALDACRRTRNAKASRRLSMLAAHAQIVHEKVLKALVDLAALQPRAIWALNKLTRQDLETPDDCKRWWKSRPSGSR